MMAIRIDRIKVNRGGPLNEDFELEPRDLNLIYGHNETGKTYIVESIINLLFDTGRGSVVRWNLREWDLAGRIVVSGLKDDSVTFTKTSRKLDDYWKEESGLPQDLSRLLVVKAGETRLVEKEDGVGRDTLKDYLSGEGLLDEIGERISSTLQEATVQNCQISGANRGEIRKRAQFREELSMMDALLRDVEQNYTSGEVYSLRKSKEKIKTELEMLKKAKRHYAARLHEDRKDLETKREELPAEEELSELESQITVYETKKDEVESKLTALKELKPASEDYRWAKNALSDYERIISGQAVTAPSIVYMIVVLVFFAGAVVTGLLGFNIPLVLCAIGSVVSLLLHYAKTQNALARSGFSRELKALKIGFEKRFGLELNDMAQLKAQANKLQEDYIRAGDLERELNGNLIPDIETRERNIRTILIGFTRIEPSTQGWRDTVSALRGSIKSLESEINVIDNCLASLAVREEDYLDQDPGIEWNRDSYETLVNELGKAEEVLKEEMNKLDLLKSRVVQETGAESAEWEDLITALRNKREEKAQECRQVTAEILAKVQVNTVIREFRQEEYTRIGDGLMREELTNPLRALTGRYGKIKLGEDRGLILTSDGDEEYPLAAMSTGAREQAFLALRMGFASITMKGQKAFVILDDAFQHSDWDRRTNLVDQTLALVRTGWQVFCFTMDDHIRDLFHKAGREVGDRFTTSELH
jgi:recombinational DNA repair ATPase RecF